MKNKTITINARKFDGQIHRSWKADLIEKKNSRLIFFGKFEKDIQHPDLGFIRRGTKSYEYYWLDRWYNVFRFHEPDGLFRNFYCNINKPPVFKNNILDYIDLDIDILVWPDFSIQVLDEEEFSVNSGFYQYPKNLIKNVNQIRIGLMNQIKNKNYPFSITNET